MDYDETAFWRWLRNKRIVYLAPHYDDLAFSNGGFTAKAANQFHLTVITVFTLCSWAPYAACTDFNEISALRDREDEVFCAEYNIRRTGLGHADSGCRGYDAVTELETAYSREENLYLAIREALKLYLEKHPCDLVIVPLGIGNHIDHRLVNRSAKDGLIGTVPILYYEDLPYAAGFHTADLDFFIRTEFLNPGYLLIDISDFISRKLAAASLYASQTGIKEYFSIYYHALRLGNGIYRHYERFWMDRQTADFRAGSFCREPEPEPEPGLYSGLN